VSQPTARIFCATGFAIMVVRGLRDGKYINEQIENSLWAKGDDMANGELGPLGLALALLEDANDPIPPGENKMTRYEGKCPMCSHLWEEHPR
jgi:hypothetical protein